MAEPRFQEWMTEMVRELLGILGVDDMRIEVFPSREDEKETLTFFVTVDRRDSKMLIGQYGVALFSIQYLLQMIARRRFDEVPDFFVDINRYWKEKKAHLRRDAEDAAHEAVATGRPVSMRPMLSYERKVVHAVLSGSERVETESIGKGEGRKVVVKPKAVFS
ncbi:MAG: hypothetical protein HGB34_00330 [Candidatus Moranbacteria bacterium]|nr:hypothetical protein [Candidatus Moranbacteria bacterium]